MSNTPSRKRRSVPRPASYKEFNEVGHTQASDTENADTLDRDEEKSQGSKRCGREQSIDSSSGGSNIITFNRDMEAFENINSDEHDKSHSVDSESNNASSQDSTEGTDLETTGTSAEVGQEVSGACSTRVCRNNNKHVKHVKHGKSNTQDTNSSYNIDMNDKNITLIADTPRKPDRKRGYKQGRRDEDDESQDQLELGVNPLEDDLDGDKTGDKHGKHVKQSKTSSNPGFGGARPKTNNKSKTKTPSKTPQAPKTPKKQKLSVANRLAKINTPIDINTGLQNNYDLDDTSFEIEHLRVNREKEEVEAQLRQHQREAELAKKRLESEATKRKIAQLKKQTERDNKKAAQERARYERTLTNKSYEVTTKQKPVAHKIKDSNQTLEQKVEIARAKAKNLNPLRRARQVFVAHDGSNNPNVDGQDNGMNAWLDYELNKEDMDDDFRAQVVYAKRNSDNNRFYNIDDVPIKGPPRDDDDIQSLISLTEATNTANELLNDDDLIICRKTGMMRKRNEASPERTQSKRRPSSTVTRATEAQQEPKNVERPRWRDNRRQTHERNRHDYWQNDQDYNRYEGRSEWDTEVEVISDEEIDRTYHLDTKQKHISFVDDRFDGRRNRDVGYYRDERERSRDDRYGPDYGHHGSRQKRVDKGRIAYYDTSSDSSPQPKRKIKSGINAKPTSSVMEQVKYPQFSLGQISGYIGQNIKFEYLTYEQFMAGELVTIGNTTNKDEIKGRTQLLQRIATWKLRTNVTWAQVRQAFAHILRRIEDHEITWKANWDDFERRIYDRVLPTNPTQGTSTVGQPRVRRSNNVEVTWFCKAYQREGCTKESPHSGKIGNAFKQLHHICAACWLKERVRRAHPESSLDCPQKEA